jgi:hypothetical protein
MHKTTPIQIPADLVNRFPDALRGQVEVVLTELRRKFKEKLPNTQYFMGMADARDFLLKRMTPLFCNEVAAERMKAAEALDVVGGFLELVVDRNPAKGWAETEELKRQLRESKAWDNFTKAIELVAADKRRGQGQAGSGDA